MFTHQRLSSSESLTRVSTLTSLIPVCSFRTDKNGIIASVNADWEAMMGLTRDQALGIPWYSLKINRAGNTVESKDSYSFYLLEKNEDIAQQWQKAIATNKNKFQIETKIINSDNSIKNLLTSFAEMKNSINGVTEYVAVVTDITELKLIEENRLKEEMQKAHIRAEVAENLNKSQSQFVNRICHEIRTPLQGIYSNINLLEASYYELESLISKEHSSKVDEGFILKLKEFIENSKESIIGISESANHQQMIADDVLNYTKLQEKKAALNLYDFDPVKIIDKVVKMTKSSISQKKIELYTKTIQQNLIVKGDPNKLSQVLLNLLTNAIKFTPENGTITISLLAPEISESTIFLNFCIEDTGIGMSEDEKKLLFSPYSQASSKISVKYGGTGLGLSICKELTELMGGEIKVETSLGKGSKFSFSIMCSMSVQEQKLFSSKSLLFTPSPITCSKAKILVIEDNLSTLKVTCKLLHRSGYQSVSAQNAIEGIDKWKNDHFDVILIDEQLPGMSGSAATQNIRLHEQETICKSPISIIGISGNVGEEYRLAAIQSGMDYYFVKPYSHEILVNCIEQCLQDSANHKKLKSFSLSHP